MKNLLLTLVLALAWTVVQGAFTLGNFGVGLVLSYVVLRLLQPLLGEAGYDRRIYYQLVLTGVFLKELVLSSIRVATEVLTPGFGMRAGILAVPLSVKSEFGVTLFANLISLTPGTLSLDVSDDREYLYIHAMYIDSSPEEEALDLKRTLESRVILALGEEATAADDEESGAAPADATASTE
jgi:multicomponent Na+:H+ antiporter subunit E